MLKVSTGSQLEPMNQADDRTATAYLKTFGRQLVKGFASCLSSDDRKIATVKNVTSRQDLHDTITKARPKYEASRRNQKTRKWLGKVATRSQYYYGGIMYVLVYHHPEYVTLAWGTLKFLIVVSHLNLGMEVQKLIDTRPSLIMKQPSLC